MKRTIEVPQTLYRTGTSIIDKEKGTVRLSISSDVPYLRYDWRSQQYFYEVLDHAKGLDTTRLKAGTSLLYNHNRDVLLGRNTFVGVMDGKAVVDALISKAPDVESYRVKIEEGILTDSSVGYTVDDEGEEIGEKDGIPIIKVGWMAHEASLVTIPADQSVGIGRDHNPAWNVPAEGKVPLKEIEITSEKDVDATRNNENTRTTEKTNMETPASPAAPEVKVDLVKERGDAVSNERERVKKINDYVGALKNPAWKEAAATVAVKAIETGTDFDTFRTDAINSFEGVRQAVETPEIGMTDKEVKRFSFLGAIRQMATKGRLEGFEKETCEAAQKQMRRELSDSRSFVLPAEVSRHQDEQMLFNLLRSMTGRTRAQNAGSGPAGGYTIETQYGALVELLRNRTVLGKLGITILDGLVGDFVMPVQTGGAIAYWVSETGTITDSEAAFGQKAMVPHRLGASIPFTMQFIAQSSLSVDAFTRNELDIVMALKKDAAGLLGTGLGGEPLGVANTPGINATVTYSGAAAWADVVEHETGIAVDNADIGSMGFVLDAAAVGKWKTILKDSVAGAGYLIGEGMTANGYPVERSNQISAAHQSFFGVWSQLLLGIWAGREITVDNITLAKSGQHQIIMNELCDFLVRQPLAFNVSTDSAAQ